MPCAYVRIVGSGRAYQGNCIVRGIVFSPDTANDYADIYDGLDDVSGERVFRVKTSTLITWNFPFSCGIQFSHGVYVAGIDSAVETTIFFEPTGV